MALGGALLLTHFHAIASIKDQLLVEMSHTPLALCGVAAGWAALAGIASRPQAQLAQNRGSGAGKSMP
jgi:hypothetical protein